MSVLANEELALWSRVRQHGDAQARDTLLEWHLPYAKVVAATYFARRINDEIEFGDYLQFARVGLLEAFERYDPDAGAQFRTFAARRMHGAILDGLAQMTEKQEQIAARRRVLAERLGSMADASADEDGRSVSAPTTAEPPVPGGTLRYLAEIGMGLALGYMLEDTNMFDSGQPRATTGDPLYTALELRQRRQALRAMVKQLPAAERCVVQCHYQQGVPFEEIAQSMNLSKGRISQIHKKALNTLRTLMSSRNRCDLVL